MKIRSFVSGFKHKIHPLVALLATVGLIAHLSDSVSAYTATNGGWNWTVQGTSITYDGANYRTGATRASTLSNGITVSVSTSGSGVAIATTDQTLATRGGIDTNYARTGIAASTGVQLVTFDDGCTFGTFCNNRGTVTLTFSQKVTDPVWSFAGVGGGAQANSGQYRTVTWS